jgi:methionyl-tRNA synthetase
MKTKYYITTAIPYVNADPHVGFALELVQADTIARLHRHAGCAVRLQTGTDENAFKNVEAARVAGVDPKAWVETHAARFRQLADHLNVGYDRFVRTTEGDHTRAVHEFWRSLRPDDIFKREYRGLYCTGCEDFLFEKDLIAGKCPDHGQAPGEVSETNYFFRLSAYQEQIEHWLTSGAVTVLPEKRRNEILQFVRAGLQDISISRPAARSGGWGIPVPGDGGHVVYVWIDALVNYLTGLGYGTDDRWTDWWNGETQKVHVIGRNVWKFHAIYWPALLLSAGLPLPDKLVIHGFLTSGGLKISKSLGNTVAPGDYISRYGAEAVRYFLLRGVSPFDDGDFSTGRFAAVYESDLVNGLGNLVSRLLALAVKSGLSRVSTAKRETPADSFERACRAYLHHEALAALWRQIDELNRDIDRVKPWVALKQGNPELVQSQVDEWLQGVSEIARSLAPFLPETSSKVLSVLGKSPLQASAPLFPRVIS